VTGFVEFLLEGAFKFVLQICRFSILGLSNCRFVSTDNHFSNSYDMEAKSAIHFSCIKV